MKKTILIVVVIILLLLTSLFAIFGFGEIEEDTSAYSGSIILQRDLELKVEPRFDYGHYLYMRVIENTDDTSSSEITIALYNNSQSYNQTYKFRISQEADTMIQLGFLEPSEYTLKVIDFDDVLNQKEVSASINVVGGGPSISIANAKQIQPQARTAFYVSIGLLALFIILLIRSFKKADIH